MFCCRPPSHLYDSKPLRAKSEQRRGCVCDLSGRASRTLLDISSERLGLAANAKYTPCSSRCCCPRTAIANKESPPTVIAHSPPAREQRGVEPAPWFGPTLRRAMQRAPADERWCDCFFPPFFLFSPLVWCLSEAWGPTNLSLFVQNRAAPGSDFGANVTSVSAELRGNRAEPPANCEFWAGDRSPRMLAAPAGDTLRQTRCVARGR